MVAQYNDSNYRSGTQYNDSNIDMAHSPNGGTV